MRKKLSARSIDKSNEFRNLRQSATKLKYIKWIMNCLWFSLRFFLSHSLAHTQVSLNNLCDYNVVVCAPKNSRPSTIGVYSTSQCPQRHRRSRQREEKFNCRMSNALACAVRASFIVVRTSGKRFDFLSTRFARR